MNLAEAVLHLLKVSEGAAIDPDYIQQLRDLKVPETEIQHYIQAQNKLNRFDVWPENWDAIQLFIQSQTQRIHSGMKGIVTGFNYPGVEVVMKANGYDWPVFKRFQKIEQIALKHWNQ